MGKRGLGRWSSAVPRTFRALTVREDEFADWVVQAKLGPFRDASLNISYPAMRWDGCEKAACAASTIVLESPVLHGLLYFS